MQSPKRKLQKFSSPMRSPRYYIEDPSSRMKETEYLSKNSYLPVDSRKKGTQHASTQQKKNGKIFLHGKQMINGQSEDANWNDEVRADFWTQQQAELNSNHIISPRETKLDDRRDPFPKNLKHFYREQGQDSEFQIQKLKNQIKMLEGTIKNLEVLNQNLVLESRSHGSKLDQFANTARKTIRKKDERIIRLEQQMKALSSNLQEKQRLIGEIREIEGKNGVISRQRDDMTTKINEIQQRAEKKEKEYQSSLQYYENIINQKEVTIRNMSAFNNQVCMRILDNKRDIDESTKMRDSDSSDTKNIVPLTNKNLTYVVSEKNQSIDLLNRQISQLRAVIFLQSEKIDEMKSENNVLKDIAQRMENVIHAQEDVIVQNSNQAQNFAKPLKSQKVSGFQPHLNKQNWKNTQPSESTHQSKSNISQLKNKLFKSDESRVYLCEESDIFYQLIEQKDDAIRKLQISKQELSQALQCWKKELKEVLELLGVVRMQNYHKSVPSTHRQAALSLPHKSSKILANSQRVSMQINKEAIGKYQLRQSSPLPHINNQRRRLVYSPRKPNIIVEEESFKEREDTERKDNMSCNSEKQQMKKINNTNNTRVINHHSFESNEDKLKMILSFYKKPKNNDQEDLLSRKRSHQDLRLGLPMRKIYSPRTNYAHTIDNYLPSTPARQDQENNSEQLTSLLKDFYRQNQINGIISLKNTKSGQVEYKDTQSKKASSGTQTTVGGRSIDKVHQRKLDTQYKSPPKTNWFIPTQKRFQNNHRVKEKLSYSIKDNDQKMEKLDRNILKHFCFYMANREKSY